MPTPWIRAVQETGQLTVCPGDQLKRAASWGEGLFGRILDEFNRLATVNRLGVRLVRNDTKPSHTSATGASVLFETSNGDCKFFDHTGKEQHEVLKTGPGRLHGLTAAVTVPPLNKIGWAFVFVPLNPIAGKTPVGPNVKMAIGLHELLHACGLQTEDPGHEPPGSQISGDIYDGHGIMSEGDDHEFVGGSMQPDSNGRFFLRARTAGLVQSVWLLGQF
jgi:hypothetical protein